jgi:hypothetical protein
MNGRIEGKIDGEYHRNRPAVAREESVIYPCASGTHPAHKTLSENEFLRVFEHLSLIRQISD